MVLHPHVLKKAHEEIDRVVGTSRLPDFDDRENLPYIEAIFQEVLRCASSIVVNLSALNIVVCRWRPVVPLGE